MIDHRCFSSGINMLSFHKTISMKRRTSMACMATLWLTSHLTARICLGFFSLAWLGVGTWLLNPTMEMNILLSPWSYLRSVFSSRYLYSCWSCQSDHMPTSPALTGECTNAGSLSVNRSTKSQRVSSSAMHQQEGLHCIALLYYYPWCEHSESLQVLDGSTPHNGSPRDCCYRLDELSVFTFG